MSIQMSDKINLLLELRGIETDNARVRGTYLVPAVAIYLGMVTLILKDMPKDASTVSWAAVILFNNVLVISFLSIMDEIVQIYNQTEIYDRQINYLLGKDYILLSKFYNEKVHSEHMYFYNIMVILFTLSATVFSVYSVVQAVKSMGVAVFCSILQVAVFGYSFYKLFSNEKVYNESVRRVMEEFKENA